jgi:hypothetical protein
MSQTQILRWQKPIEDVFLSKVPKSALPIKAMLLSQPMRSVIEMKVVSSSNPCVES